MKNHSESLRGCQNKNKIVTRFYVAILIKGIMFLTGRKMYKFCTTSMFGICIAMCISKLTVRAGRIYNLARITIKRGLRI